MDRHTESILLHTYSREELERLKQIEASSKRKGMLYGLLVSFGVAGLYKIKKNQGAKVSTYFAGVASLVSGLITSQLGTHYLFLRASDQIRFERRMKAALQFEDSKRK